MPQVRNAQAAVVQGRVQRAQLLIEPALEHRRAGKGKGHREADIAGVENRRMHRERRDPAGSD